MPPKQLQALRRIRRHLTRLYAVTEVLADLRGFFRDRLSNELMSGDVTISLRKLAGAFLDLGATPGVNINQGAVQLQLKVEEVPERVRQAVVQLKQSCDLKNKKFVRKVMDLLDAGPEDGREMLMSVLADINHEEKQVLKKVDYHAAVISSTGSPESEAFWATHFGSQSTIPWRVFQDIFVQLEYGDLDHAAFAQLTFTLRKYLDPQGTGTVAHHRFVQFLDTKWAAVKTEFVPQRGLKLPTQRRDAEALPLLVMSVLRPTLYIREGMSFSLTQQGYPLSMRLHKDGISVFGRKSERAKGIVDIQLDDPSVSQIHAQVVFRENKFWLVDLGSTGGTYILMQKKTSVRPGFVFQLGFHDVFVVTEINGEQLFSLDGNTEEVVEAGAWFARGGLEPVQVQAAPHAADLGSEEEEERKAVPPPLDDLGELSSVARDEEYSDSASSGEYQEEGSGSESASESASGSASSRDEEEDGGGDEGISSDEDNAIPEESKESSSQSYSQSDSQSYSQNSQSKSQKSSAKAAPKPSAPPSHHSSASQKSASQVSKQSSASASQRSGSQVSKQSSVSESVSSQSRESESSESDSGDVSVSGSASESASIHEQESIYQPAVQPNIELLCVLKGEHLGRRWRFPADPEGVTIGKSHGSHIRLHNSQIKSKHCRFVVENGAWVMDDYGAGDRVWLMLSDYSTLRRKEPSGAYLLESGSCFKIGGIDFQVGG